MIFGVSNLKYVSYTIFDKRKTIHYTGRMTLPSNFCMLSFWNCSTIWSHWSFGIPWTRAFVKPFLSQIEIMYPLVSVRTNPLDSSTTAYRFSSPTGSHTSDFVSRKASAGIALLFVSLLRYSRDIATRFFPRVNA